MNIREVNRKYLVTATGENPLCMKTFGNGRKALQRNVKLLQLYNCTFEKMTNRVSARCQQGVSKVLTSCQQGVNKLSTRCQICNHLPMKKYASHLICLCLSSENNLCICVCICKFFGGRDEVQKKYFEKWRGGGPKCGFLIIEQSPFDQKY